MYFAPSNLKGKAVKIRERENRRGKERREREINAGLIATGFIWNPPSEST